MFRIQFPSWIMLHVAPNTCPTIRIHPICLAVSPILFYHLQMMLLSDHASVQLAPSITPFEDHLKQFIHFLSNFYLWNKQRHFDMDLPRYDFTVARSSSVFLGNFDFKPRTKMLGSISLCRFVWAINSWALSNLIVACCDIFFASNLKQ